ncbi:hypothetical protein OIU79_022308 [Salix purpurea]|uniref:Uncharacterized protein n=1 Tax=Salix purpurea TaxID=77065 RepID=A0A9Q0WIB1_SALPP|nr:hypothetical protein OIU79_022308 [Salix purpurea]
MFFLPSFFLLERESRSPMGEEGENPTAPPLPPSAAAEGSRAPEAQSDPPTPFDPSRMIGVIKRKGLIKELAAVYHAQCLFYCQQLLELQKNCQEPFVELKAVDDSRKETMRGPKRLKKSR